MNENEAKTICDNFVKLVNDGILAAETKRVEKMLHANRRMNELLPCPFCGGNATLWSDGYMDYVECDVCGAKSQSCYDPQLAVRKWNTRAWCVPEETCHFIGYPNGDDGYCSRCHEYMFKQDAYCPACGAKVVSE